MNRCLSILGFGYSASRLATLAAAQGWEIAGTSRSEATRNSFQSLGYNVVDFTRQSLERILPATTHLLISIPLAQDWNDPVLANFESLIRKTSPHLEWIGYLSTTGVYGDHQGAWVDEDTLPTPQGARAIGRVKAEKEWLALGFDTGVPTQAFRLAGIYGPGRNVLRQLENAAARSIYKEGQFFSRIHVDDIAAVVMASMTRPQAGAIYNVCDDCPTPAHEVIEYAAGLLKIPPPERISYAQAQLSDMGKEFYNSSRRVRNDKIKTALDIELNYPTYREGLSAMLASGDY